jgi:hypothetical protein
MSYSTSRIRTVVTVGDNLRPVLAEGVGEYADQLRAVMNRVGERLQGDLRGQVRAANLGMGLEKAWQQRTYPARGRSLRPAALVYSKSTVLHDAYDAGPAVLPRRGRFLVIALPRAVELGYGHTEISRKGGRVPAGQKRRYSMLAKASRELKAKIVSSKPGLKGKRKRQRGFKPYILLVPSKRSRANLVALYFAKEDSKGEPLFSLVRATRVQKRLDIDAAAKRAEADLASELNRIGD